METNKIIKELELNYGYKFNPKEKHEFNWICSLVKDVETVVSKNESLHLVSKTFNTRLETSDGTFKLTPEELKRWEDDGYCEKGSKFYGTVLIKEF